MECLANARKVDGSLQKVPRPQGKLREGPSAAWKVEVTLRRALRPHRKLMDGPADARKAHGRSADVLEVYKSYHPPPKVAARSC